MSSKPIIFISSVTKELASARDLVAKVVHLLGYEPKWQNIAPTEQGDLRGVLRKWVDDSEAVIQLVGHCYGEEPQEPDPDFGRVSYTQYEALYARKCGKPVWYFFEDEGFTADAHGPEPEDLRQLQQAYHDRVRATGDLRHRFASLLELENSILKLRDDLTHLRRRWKLWTTTVLVLLVVIVLGGGGVYYVMHRQSGDITEVKAQNEKLLTIILRELPGALAKEGGSQKPEAEAARLSAAYAALEKKYNLQSGSLAVDLPRFARKLSVRADASHMDRASALFAVENFAESETQALLAKDEALAAGKPPREVISALTLAGRSAEALYHDADAMRHYKAAAALTDAQRDPLEWVRTQEDIAFAHVHDRQYREAEKIFREASTIRTQVQGPEHPETLSSRNNVARALDDQGRYAEAEKAHREVLAIRERVLGPGHLDTISSRNNLARVLDAQGRHGEADNERSTAREITMRGYRDVLAIAERMLGPEHPDTLNNRNQVGIALARDGNFAEAEKEFRAVQTVRQRVLGAEHRDTLVSRSNVASTLDDQHKYDEAEREHREILGIRVRLFGTDDPDTLTSRRNLIRALTDEHKDAEAEEQLRALLAVQERLLGPENPDTLNTRYDLAEALRFQSKNPESERVQRTILAARERAFGPDHPATLSSRISVASALADQGRHAEAEKELRTVLAIRERLLGPEHPGTLMSRGNVARALADQKKHAEAEKELRTVLTIRERVLGAEDPDTLISRNMLAGALAEQGRHAEAEKEFRIVLAIRQRELAVGHPETMATWTDVALELGDQGKYAEAEKEHREILAVRERVRGAQHPSVFDSCYQVAECLEKQARFPEALAFAERALAGYEKTIGKDNHDTENARKMVERVKGK